MTLMLVINVSLLNFSNRVILSEPEFYGDLEYKFKKIMSRTDFSDQFRKVIIHNKRIG